MEHAGVYGASEALVSEIEAPNGERSVYHYTGGTYDVVVGGTPEEPITEEEGPFYRLQSVTTNRGYQLHIRYQGNSMADVSDYADFMEPVEAQLLNNAVDYCNPLATQYTGLTETWPSLSMSYPSTYQTDFTDTLNRTTSYNFDVNGNLTRIDTPEHPTGAMTFGYIGGTISSVAIDGESWTYVYSVADGVRTTTVTDPTGRVTKTESDVDTGFVLATIAVDSSVIPSVELRTEYEWSAAGLLTEVTAPEGNYTTYAYDGRGNPTTISTYPIPGSAEDTAGHVHTVTAVYPSSCTNPRTCNRPTSVTDTAGRTTEFTYSGPYGTVLNVTSDDPDGAGSAERPQMRYRYELQYAWYKNSAGTLVQSADPIYLLDHIYTCRTGTHATCNQTANQHRTIFRYGSANQANNLHPTIVKLKGGDDSLAGNTQFACDAVGNLLEVNPPGHGDENATFYRYDLGRQQVAMIGPDPDDTGPLAYPATRTSYDDDGRPTKFEFGTVAGTSDTAWAAFAAQEYQTVDYDASGRIEVSRLYDNVGSAQALLHYAYDDAGRVECIAQRMNPAAFGSLPSTACNLGTQGSYGPDRILHHSYNGLGRVDVITVAYASTAPATEMTRGFTDNGLLAWIQDAEANRTEYVYDGFGRVTEQRYPDVFAGSEAGDANDAETFTYFAPIAANEGYVGMLASRTTRPNATSGTTFDYEYDLLGRVILVDAPTGDDLEVTYDNHGQVLTLGHVGGDTITNTYNGCGWLASQAGPNGSVSYT